MTAKEETTINDRVLQVINHYNLNRNKFSKALGLNNSMTINNIVGGRRSKPSYDILRKIAERFPVNPSWLLLGKGAMFLDDENTKNDLKIPGYNKMEVNKIMEAILLDSEKFEQHPMFAKYVESKCDKAIIAYQNQLLLDYKKG